MLFLYNKKTYTKINQLLVCLLLINLFYKKLKVIFLISLISTRISQKKILKCSKTFILNKSNYHEKFRIEILIYVLYITINLYSLVYKISNDVMLNKKFLTIIK